MKWKDPYVPRHVVQMIPVDATGKLLVMHRSNTVRSARNVWSFPSGMHEIGAPLEVEARREMKEEYGLEVLDLRYIGTYENIAGDADAIEQYHWVITVLVVLVADVTKSVNKEPDKHDQMKHIHIDELRLRDFFDVHKFHSSFDLWARANIYDNYMKLRAFVGEQRKHV